MSDVMLEGILRMPYELAMSSEVMRRQYWETGRQAMDEINRLRAAVRAEREACAKLCEEMQRKDDSGERLAPLLDAAYAIRSRT